eukprot:CAMPEP_0202916206 /NCGR_PEP_ID=MMETSP1392-20130828/67962_1 /ASSEMBLY_ACC=CAM_ASM_000868 /TAXON_ID=225041 /ORGANISM="Chlamydomonas chlamydogama, Strain SAG 11-48b" /LENGTH=386 /DNA_ID=CAMNT_0049608543 /DNA_START=24 /DNA_END=1181 /DNA_ORIENTATION=+
MADAQTIKELAALYDSRPWFEEGRTVAIQLSALEDETRCPICYGKIRNARVSSVCLHRYCASCIDHCLRLEIPGRPPEVKECPVCRAHLHSRRATKPDPKFDLILQALYGDLGTYEAEEEQLSAACQREHAAELAETMERMKQAQAQQRESARAALHRGGSGGSEHKQQQQHSSDISPGTRHQAAGSSRHHKGPPEPDAPPGERNRRSSGTPRGGVQEARGADAGACSDERGARGSRACVKGESRGGGVCGRGGCHHSSMSCHTPSALPAAPDKGQAGSRQAASRQAAAVAAVAGRATGAASSGSVCRGRGKGAASAGAVAGSKRPRSRTQPGATVGHAARPAKKGAGRAGSTAAAAGSSRRGSRGPAPAAAAAAGTARRGGATAQ